MTSNQHKGGSSITLLKTGKLPITIPKSNSVNKAYIEMARDAVAEYESEVN